MRRNILHLLLLLLPLCTVAQTTGKVPATEIRAAWLTTNWRLDWPKENRTNAQQKTDLRDILNKLKKANFNTVFFQVRAQGNTFYRSSIEEQSPYVKNLDFDPLAFAIAECHVRGMECHAWFVTFPMGNVKRVKKGKTFVTEYKPSHYRAVKGEWYLDPGSPLTTKLVLSLVKELVGNYDIDGIHFDYIRYPSPDRKFPDEVSYKIHGKTKDLYEWRRENINTLVTKIYDTTKSMKKWVQVSSSPLGKYKPISGQGGNGWNAYETVFQDAAKWMIDGKHDALYPMLYYKGNDFYPYLDDWVINSNNRPIVPGLGIYQMLPKEGNWDAQLVLDQMAYTRKNKIAGQAYFRAGIIMDDVKGIKGEIETFYKHPAKLPPMPWLSKEIPQKPQGLELYKDKDGMLHIVWQHLDSDACTYTVYASPIENVDRNDGRRVVGTRIRTNSYSFKPSVGNYGFYYTVTASDRYHNESELGHVAFFSHASNEQ